MKKLTLIFVGLLAITFRSSGYGYSYINSYADGFVFDEMGITFAVYPDGEFDFYLANGQQSNTVSNGYVNVTFNSGYNYNPYVQYDDFGAVIQVENVPIWYDYYGRVTQIGDVMINYNNRRVCQVGGLYVHYNSYGYYAYHTGYINTWNPYFVFRPFYVAFARPVVNMCFVRQTPYRQYYTPVRYAYYRPYVQNVRPCYATIGHTYRPSGHGVAHARYTQTAGRGEVPVRRERSTVTTAQSSQQRPAVNRSSVSERSAVQPSQVRNAPSVSQRPTATQTSRPVNDANNVRVQSTRPQAASTQSRPVQSAPVRTGAQTQSSSSNRPVSTQPRTAATSTRSTSQVRQNMPAQNSMSSKPASSVSRTQATRTTAKPQSNVSSTPSRSAAGNSGTRPSSVSSSRGTSTVAKAPSTRASAPSSAVKSGAARTTVKRSN